MESIPSLHNPAISNEAYKKVLHEEALAKFLPQPSFDVIQALDHTYIQDSWAYRNAFQAREIAKLIINQQGQLEKEILLQISKELRSQIYSLAPDQEQDNLRKQHLLSILEKLATDKSLVQLLKAISRPFGHRPAEENIRQTLLLDEKTMLTDAHAKQAALAALMCSLRQNVGSCFATAPAILIQQEQPHHFLKDIAQMLATGRLKRIFEGIEYTAPLNATSGLGDLKRPFYLFQFGKNPVKTLSYSPGLILAFESVNLIQHSTTVQEKHNECFALLNQLDFLREQQIEVINVEMVLKAILLNKHGLTLNDLKEFDARPKERMMGDLLISSTLSMSAKNASCAHYYKDLEQAKNAFKKITENALLKSWEFTLASFAETKADFCRWHLQVSLGFDAKEPYGIGQCVHAYIEDKLVQINKNIEELQSNYEHLFAQAKSLEGRARSASSENDLGWIQAEYQIRRFEINQILNQRDEEEDKGRKLAGLNQYLLNYYNDRFKEYFQETYDPQMQDVSANMYDDSPAGFRLLYKHGRPNTSLWTGIYSAEEFIQALSAFFVATETELANSREMEGLQKELTEIITSFVILIKTKEFLEASLQRMLSAYQHPSIESPLENLEKIQKKPWAYVSGGTMGTLISTYYGLGQLPKVKERWVENETELLVFYLDSLKELPLNQQKAFLSHPQKSLLAYSPTHAFLLKPGFQSFKEGWWDNDTYTYTWIRDRYIIPAKYSIESTVLDQRMMNIVIEELTQKIPQDYRMHFKHLFSNFPYAMTSIELRNYLIKTLSYEKWMLHSGRLNFFTEELDSLLFSLLPFFPEYELWERLKAIFETMKLSQEIIQKLSELFENFSETLGRYHLFSAKQLKEIARSLLMLVLKSSNTSVNYMQLIISSMHQNKYKLATPILFADTNWVKNYFGFIMSPGTGQLELWRFDEYGQEGRPISIWKDYLNGSQKLPWGLYISPKEYC